jgi:serine/threonine protein kinase
VILTHKDDPEMTKAFVQEIIIMWRLQTEPNIARFIGYAEAPMMILMQFYPEGSLRDYIHSVAKGPLPIDQIVSLARGMACGINAIHALGFVHCDIKVTKFYILKLKADGQCAIK